MKILEKVKHVVKTIVNKLTGYDESYYEDSYESTIQMPQSIAAPEATSVAHADWLGQQSRPFSNPNLPSNLETEPEAAQAAPVSESYPWENPAYSAPAEEAKPVNQEEYKPGDPSYLWTPPVVSAFAEPTGDASDLNGQPRPNTPAILPPNGVANATSDEQQEKQGKSFWERFGVAIIVVASILVVFAIVAWVISLTRYNAKTPAATTAVSTTAVSTVTTETTATPTLPTAIPTQTPQEAAVNDELTAASWKSDWFDLTEINLLIDKSTTADGAFYKAGVRTPDEIVAYLQTGTDSANALLAAIIDLTGSTKESVLNPSNWVAIQSSIDFTYPGNTGFVNGKVVDLGSRKGNKGDIFLGYVSPETGKIVFVRAACANPQAFTPIPDTTPTPTPTPAPTPTPTLTPKNPKQDPAAQSNAPVGSGTNQDTGPGDYVAPTDMVTPPAESRVNPTPPPAETTTPTAATTTAATTAATAATTAPTAAATTAKAPVATPTPTPIPVVPGEPAASGTPAIPD